MCMQVRVGNSRIFLYSLFFISQYSREIRAISCFLPKHGQSCVAIASKFSDARESLPAGPLKRYPVGKGIDP